MIAVELEDAALSYKCSIIPYIYACRYRLQESSHAVFVFVCRVQRLDWARIVQYGQYHHHSATLAWYYYNTQSIPDGQEHEAANIWSLSLDQQRKRDRDSTSEERREKRQRKKRDKACGVR
jgi:hypothetical protein